MTVFVCFYACESDPEPVLGGGCDTGQRCAPGVVRERYRVSLKIGCEKPVQVDPVIQDMLIGNRINYPALARWVTEPCPCPPQDACIPLANVRRPDPGGTLKSDDIDITIRPIVYSNDLLFQLLLAITSGDTQNRRGK